MYYSITLFVSLFVEDTRNNEQAERIDVYNIVHYSVNYLSKCIIGMHTAIQGIYSYCSKLTLCV